MSRTAFYEQLVGTTRLRVVVRAHPGGRSRVELEYWVAGRCHSTPIEPGEESRVATAILEASARGTK